MATEHERPTAESARPTPEERAESCLHRMRGYTIVDEPEDAYDIEDKGRAVACIAEAIRAAVAEGRSTAKAFAPVLVRITRSSGGKGVIVCRDAADLAEAIQECVARREFGEGVVTVESFS